MLTEVGAVAMAVLYGLFLSYPVVEGFDYNNMTDEQARILTRLSLGYEICTGGLIFLDIVSAILLVLSMKRIYSTIKNEYR